MISGGTGSIIVPPMIILLSSSYAMKIVPTYFFPHDTLPPELHTHTHDALNNNKIYRYDRLKVVRRLSTMSITLGTRPDTEYRILQ